VNKKYILEYVGGTKGDMVVRFLNGVEPDISFDRANKTEPLPLDCENWLKLIRAKDMTLERFEEVLSVNPHEYLPAHPLWCCCPTTLHGEENSLYSNYIDLLKKYNYEIISLKFEPKHYVTIFIERVLKNNYKYNVVTDNDVRSSNGQFLKQLSLEEAFSGGPSQIFARFNSTQARKKFNEMTNDRTLLHYEELFCSNLPYPLHPHREDEWLMLVEQSWCKYDENDYRKFEVPEGCE
tara:strand:- start:214 stop:924 length:711 start_codon:yes stop_codon:yes gene_type:complete